MPRIERFKQHAKKMYYPQYRDKFQQMAKETNQHATQWARSSVFSKEKISARWWSS
jgi:hypothetical protein